MEVTLEQLNHLKLPPENAGNRISEALKLKIFRGSMPPDPPRGLPPSAGVYPNPNPFVKLWIHPSIQYIERSRSACSEF